MPHLMFTERVSPFGMEESIARIQHNFQNTGNGWPLSGLRNPARAVPSGGGGADAGASAHCKRFGQQRHRQQPRQCSPPPKQQHTA